LEQKIQLFILRSSLIHNSKDTDADNGQLRTAGFTILDLILLLIQIIST